MSGQDFREKNGIGQKWFWEKMESKQDQKEITVLKIDSNGTVAGKYCYHREGNTKPWNWQARGETGQSGGAQAD